MSKVIYQKNDLKKFLDEGDLRTVIDWLIALFKNTGKENVIWELASRYDRLRRNMIMNTVSYEDANRENNRLRIAILALIEELDEDYRGIDENKVQSGNSKTNFFSEKNKSRQISEEIKKHIAKDEIKEALNKLKEFASEKNKQFENDVIQLMNLFSYLEKESLNGLYSDSEYTLRKSRLSYSMLNILSKIEEVTKGTTFKTQTPIQQSKSPAIQIFLILVILILAILYLIYSFL